MAFEIIRKDTAMYINDGSPIYLNADKTAIVEEGSPNAAFLLVGSGGQLTDEEAAKYGLKGGKRASENKLKAGPSENKAQEAEDAPVPFTPAEEAVSEEPKKKGK